MLRLYTLWEIEWELSPEDFQHILTPRAALEKAAYRYDLDYRNYTLPPVNEIPRLRDGFNNKPYLLFGCYPPGKGHKARVFQSALGYNPTNSDVLGRRVQEGILTAPASALGANQHGQRMAVEMPILGANGETAIVRSGWIYEPDSLVPRMTTIFVK